MAVDIGYRREKRTRTDNGLWKYHNQHEPRHRNCHLARGCTHQSQPTENTQKLIRWNGKLKQYTHTTNAKQNSRKPDKKHKDPNITSIQRINTHDQHGY